MCFNLAMYDNVSGGVYLDKEKRQPDMKDIDDDYIKGSIQKWYMTADEDDKGVYGLHDYSSFGCTLLERRTCYGKNGSCSYHHKCPPHRQWYVSG